MKLATMSAMIVTVFHSPDLIAGIPPQVEKPVGLEIVAVAPTEWETIIPTDPTHPKMWTYPAATFDLTLGYDHKPTKIWYQRVDKDAPVYEDQRVLCLGTLTDKGLQLEKVRDGSPAWGGVDNVVLRRSPHKPTWGGFNVFQIATTSTGGFDLLYWDQPAEGEAGAMLASSPDGVNWTKSEKTVFTEHNDAFTLYSDTKDYQLYQTMLEDWPDKPYADNLDKKRRVIALRTSSDLKAWTPQEVVLRPDAQDPPETEFYLLKVFNCGASIPEAKNYRAGLLMKYFADPAKPNEHSGMIRTELVTSPDGRTWQRPFRDTDMGFWTYADPIQWNGRLTFVAGKDNAMHLVKSRGLLALAAKDDGSFIYKLDKLANGRTHITADARSGWISAQPRSATGEAIGEPIRIENEVVTGRTIIPDHSNDAEEIEIHLHAAKIFELYSDGMIGF